MRLPETTRLPPEALFRSQLLRQRHFEKLMDQPPECSLVDLRRSVHKSQEQLAASLGVKQVAVSRLERRGDLLVSTLAAYVEAAGGQLHLIVRLPGRAVRLRLANVAAVGDLTIPS